MMTSRLRLPLLLALISSSPGDATAQNPVSDPAAIRIKNCKISLADERELASGQTGIIAKIHVREGDEVKKGQLLVELEAAVPEASLAVAAKEAENDVDVRFAKVAAKVAEAEYRLSLAANEQQPETFSHIELEKLRLEEERSELQIEVSSHEYAVAQLKRDEAETVVDTYRIVAPADGIISKRTKDEGEAVQVGETVLEFVNPGVMHILGDLPVEYLGRVKRGTRVKVVPEIPHPMNADQEQLPEGDVLFVGFTVYDVSRSVDLFAEVDNSSGMLLAGTVADLIVLPPAEEALSENSPAHKVLQAGARR